MPGRSYVDFDLLIEKAGEGYRAHVINSPAGQGTAEFRSPLNQEELAHLLPRFAWPRRGRNLLPPEPAGGEDVKSFGQRLFRAVFSGEVEICLRRSLGMLGPGQGLRFRLRLNGVPELARLPWEYLYDPQRDYLCLSADTPVVRYPELPRPIPPFQVELPLQVLVVVANPEGMPPLDVEAEWSRIERALAGLSARGLLNLERLRSPTLEALNERLRRAPEPQPGTEASRAIDLTVGQWTFLRIENRFSRVLNIVVLDLQPDWGITQIHPGEGEGAFFALDPGQVFVLPLEGQLPEGITDGTDLLKVFATLRTTDFRWLELAALNQPQTRDQVVRGTPASPLEELFAALRSNASTMRNLVPSSSPSQEWVTAQVEVRIRRPPH
jgi:hypothetical protein